MQKLAGEPVKTFSIGFPVPEFDETSYAAAGRRALGHGPPRVSASSRERVDVLEKLVWHYDEPFADSSAIPDLLRLAS